jgi:xanthine phosphoribosyltransferase
LKKEKYTYEMFTEDSKYLANEVKEFNPEVILAIARGGVTLGHFLASILDNRNLFTINSISYEKDKQLSTIDIFNVPDLSKYNKVLIVDDIVDSGKTLKEILLLLNSKYPNTKFEIASIYYKTRAVLKPNYYVREATTWIDFFWETDITS